MFDEVTKREGGKNAVKRAGFVTGSTAFQVLLVLAVWFAGQRVTKAVMEPPPVDVKFVKPVAPPPPPPPPAARPPPPKNRPPPSDKPKTDLPKPPPPQALIQPQDVKQEMKVDNSPKEPDYDYGPANGDEGVVGGQVGAVAPKTNEVEDAPAYATTGYRKPEMAVKNCVREAVRLPRGLEGYVSTITVKFAIGRDGQPSQFQVLTNVPDRRIGDAIWNAIQSCKWVPGADPQGRPTSIWVMMPFKFASQ